MKTKIGVAVAVLAAALAAGIYRAKRSERAPAEAATALTAVVQQGPLVISVRGTGDVRSRNSNKIIPGLKRGATLSFLVPEGTRVASNEVVARFNPEEVDRRIKDLETSVAETESKLMSARTELDIQVMDNTSNVTRAEQDLRNAKLALEKFLQGDAPLEQRVAELKLQTSRSDEERREKRHREAQDLLKEGFVTEDEVEEERMAMETAKVGAETAAIELRLLKEYSLPLKETSFEMALAKAETEVEKVRMQTAALYRNKSQTVDTARRALERVQSDLDAARKEREAYEVVSPAAGVTMYGSPEEFWRRGEIQVGTTIQPGQVLMTVPDTKELLAAINIPEADIRKVQLGQKATLRVEAAPDKTYDAEVAKVAEVANAGGWWASDVKEFKVELSIRDGASLKPGFTCQAEITIDTLPSAIYLPVPAVFRDGKRYIVYPADPPSADPVEVRVGRSSVQYAEILEGVSPGMRVLLTAPEKTARKP